MYRALSALGRVLGLALILTNYWTLEGHVRGHLKHTRRHCPKLQICHIYQMATGLPQSSNDTWIEPRRCLGVDMPLSTAYSCTTDQVSDIIFLVRLERLALFVVEANTQSSKGTTSR